MFPQQQLYALHGPCWPRNDDLTVPGGPASGPTVRIPTKGTNSTGIDWMSTHDGGS